MAAQRLFAVVQLFGAARIADAGSAYSLASGFACGVAVSFTPLVGFHLLLACGLAYFIRGNLATALLGTIFGNPWTFPLIFVLLQAIGEGLIRYFGLFSNRRHLK